MTDRWQKFTEEKVSVEMLEKLGDYCDEFLVHGVDVEGMGSGMEEALVKLLAKYDGNSITYAGGIASMEQIERFGELCDRKLDFTIGSALDLFGGNLSYDMVKDVR